MRPTARRSGSTRPACARRGPFAPQGLGDADHGEHGGPMADEILKDTFANHAFEAFEIAAYKSLITMAEATGNIQFVAALRQSLQEEERMRQWIEDNVEKVTRMYLEREARGEKADR